MTIMPSAVALRIVLGASLGLGALDVVWINVALAPELAAGSRVDGAAKLGAATTSSSTPPTTQPADISPRADTSARVAATTDAAPVATMAGVRVVYFATMSAALDDKARAVLEELAANISEDAVLVLEGHADHRGDEHLNDRLSRDRASAVATELARHGIPRARMSTRHVGETQATAGNAREVWRDRRVDIQITGGGGSR